MNPPALKFLYTTLALLIYVQSFALYGLRDYSCCGSHTRTEVKAKKYLPVALMKNTDVTPTKPKINQLTNTMPAMVTCVSV